MHDMNYRELCSFYYSELIYVGLTAIKLDQSKHTTWCLRCLRYLLFNHQQFSIQILYNTVPTSNVPPSSAKPKFSLSIPGVNSINFSIKSRSHTKLISKRGKLSSLCPGNSTGCKIYLPIAFDQDSI